MNIKNFKRYADRTALPIWTKRRINIAQSYKGIKSILMQQIEIDRSVLRNSKYKEYKFCKKSIRQAEDVLKVISD